LPRKPEGRLARLAAFSNPQGDHMKKQILNALALASFVVVLTVASASAGIQSPIKVKVPFDFTVGGQTLPAGVYTVCNLTPYTLAIQSEDRKQSTTILVNEKVAGRASERSRLAFRRFGDRYFFAQVWVAGNDRGYETILSKGERELTKDSSKHLARRVAEPEMVYIAAK
jgi:hypothetical protein